MTQEAITNSEGYVAMVYYQPTQKLINVHGTDYVFTLNKNISLTYVRPSDVQELLQFRKQCCGGNSQTGVFKLANDMQVRIWSNLTER